MTALEFLYYTLAIAVIIIALGIIVVTVFVVLILQEIRKTLIVVQKAAGQIRYWKGGMQSDIIGSVISLGKYIFKKKSDA